MASEIERRITVEVHIDDKVSTYEIHPRERASRTFPPHATPAEIGAWTARTALTQSRDAARSYPLPVNLEDLTPEPTSHVASILSKPANQATDAEVEEVEGSSLDDLPF